MNNAEDSQKEHTADAEGKEGTADCKHAALNRLGDDEPVVFVAYFQTPHGFIVHRAPPMNPHLSGRGRPPTFALRLISRDCFSSQPDFDLTHVSSVTLSETIGAVM